MADLNDLSSLAGTQPDALGKGTLPPLIPESEFRLKGTGIVQPLGIGKAKVIVRQNLNIQEQKIQEADVPNEIDRLKNSAEQSIQDINEIYDKVSQYLPADKSQIILVHTALTNDLSRIAQNLIRESLVTAECAVTMATNDIVQSLKKNVMLEHAIKDTNEIKYRILCKLLGVNSQEKITDPEEKIVLIVEELALNDIASVGRKNLAAVCSVSGGVRDHAAIILTEMGIPYVTGLDNVILAVDDGDTLAVNGIDGNVFINPEPLTLENLESTLEHYKLSFKKLDLRDYPPQTLDNQEVVIYANGQKIDSVREINHSGVSGIGLYRTEFLFLNKQVPPSEEEQFAHYSALTFAMQPKPVTIRTIDFGGDKIPEWSNLPIDSLGSSIGIKGIRFSLVDERNLSIFKTHIRAILRASAHGPINIMFPMINDVEEFESALQAVHEEMAKLKASEFNPDIKIGTMIETPSAVTSVGSILEVADFASIGTNDLTEATLQVPRQHSLYGHAFNEAHPVVLGAIRKIADVGKEKGKPISVCGAMASNPFRVPLLLGAGIRQFSVSPSKAQEINGMIQICSTIECENLVDEMIKSQRPTVARKLFEQYLVELKDRAKQQT